MENKIHIDTIEHDNDYEMVERKGKGHPDTICDHLAEEISKALCKYYLEEFGMVLHHNVDKALLVGGVSQTKYGGGKILQPIEIILAGRACSDAFGKKIPVEEIAIETSRKWLRNNIRFLTDKDVLISSKIRQGSSDLTELFSRFGKGEVPLSNDTSFGIAYYPLSLLEQEVIEIEQHLNSKELKREMPFVGEDIKVMAIRKAAKQEFTISVAMIDHFISDRDDYFCKKTKLNDYLHNYLKLEDSKIYINSADSYDNESLYLTVSGTSAEAGDDGEVGRGNRINGLITPYRPMSLEAVAGKNPISHVGKIYNRFCLLLCKEFVESGIAEAAQAFIVSQIGKPIDEPQLLHLKMKNCVDESAVNRLCQQRLKEISNLWKVQIDKPFELLC